MKFLRFIDLLMHPASRQNHQVATKTRIVIMIALSYLAASTAMLFVHENPVAANFIDPLLLIVTLFYIRLSKNIRPIIYLSMSAFFIINSKFTLNNPEFFGVGMHWYGAIIIAAMFLSGPIFGIITLLATLGVSFYKFFYLYSPLLSPEEQSSALANCIEWAFTVIMISVFALIYEKSLRLLVEKVIDTRSDLEQQRLQTMETSKLAALGEMAGGIAHEINNPLAIISGNADCIRSLVHREGMEPERVEQRLTKITDTVDRIRRIILSMKRLSRKESSSELEVISLDTLIQEVCIFYHEKMKSRGFRLISEVQKDILIECDQIQIGQVFINLLNNALDALEERPQEEGWVRIVGRSEDRFGCAIYISNSGPAIAPELAEKIMNPFFTTKEIGKGTGLGLSISKTIVEQHHGELTLQADLQFTTFVIYLPVAKARSVLTKQAV